MVNAERRQFGWRHAAGAIALAVCSCSNPAGLEHATVDVASVVVDPATSTLVVGSSAPLRARVLDAGGAPIPNASVLWTVKDPQIAGVSTSGVVTALAAGSTQVAASAGGRSGLATITVQRPPVASLVVTPAQVEAFAGGHAQLTAVLYDAGGAPLTDRTVAWSSSNENVATVDASGLVTAVAAGSATVSAASESKTATATITVTNAPVRSVDVSPTTLSLDVGATAIITTTITDANGSVVTDRAVAWSSSNPLVATVSPAGVVAGVAPGTTVITATAEGKSATASVTVTPPSVASVIVSPAAKSLTVGQTTVLAATVRDASGATLADRVVVWASSGPAVATVSQAGVVTAVAPGTVTITATSDGKSGAAAITVTTPIPAPVASVAVQPSTLSLVVGQTGALAATTKDAAGTTLTGRTVTWTSSNDLVATVSASGVVTAKAAGSVTITAMSEGKTGTATVTVTPPPVASVTVLPATATVTVGTSTGLSATLKDASGNVLTNRVVVWSTSNASVATVSPSGVVTAVGAGTAVITATSEGKTGSATITVPTPPVASVVLQPTTMTITAGQTGTITATLKDAAGNVLTGRIVTWTSSLDAIASISSSGVVTAKSTGTTTITATSEGKSATATVTVVAGPAATVIVTPSPATVRVTAALQLTATAYDANGNWITGRTPTWTSNNTTVATVSSTGVVTAKRTGTATITATLDGKSGSSVVTVTQ